MNNSVPGDNRQVSTNSSTKRGQFSIREIIIIGLLAGLVIMLGFTPFGLIHIGALNATTMHIPVLIGALVEGPKVGAFVGLIYGLFSWWSNITQPASILSPLFMNPIVSVLPRVLFPIFAFVFFWINPMKALGPRLIIAAFLGSIMQTVLVMGGMYFFYADKFAELMHISESTVGLVIVGLGASHGIPEALIAGVVVAAVALPLRKMLGKDKKKKVTEATVAGPEAQEVANAYGEDLGFEAAEEKAVKEAKADEAKADNLKLSAKGTNPINMANEFRKEHNVK